MPIRILKFCILTLCASFVTSQSSAEAGRRLANKELTYLVAELRPAVPTTETEVNIFLRILGGGVPQNVNVIIEATLNESPVVLRRPTNALWLFEGGILSEGEHELTLTVSTEDKVAADSLRAGIAVIEQEIVDLEAEIENEEDAEDRNVLIALKYHKEVELDHLQLILEGLKTVLGTETYNFTVVAPAP